MQLAAQDLACVRGSRVVLSGLNFQVNSGEILLLTGPNGAGKTTLLRTIAGFIAPHAGALLLQGGEAGRELAEHCHYVGHLNGVKHSLTVAENLRFYAAFLAGRDRSAVVRAAQSFGLGDLLDAPAAYLSAGQKRRLALARLLLVQRPLWLLDEPLASLDAAAGELLAEAIVSHLREGGLAAAATHSPLCADLARALELGGGTGRWRQAAA